MGNAYVVYKDVNWIQLVGEGQIDGFCIKGFKNGVEFFY
jgi:hypothetical protein